MEDNNKLNQFNKLYLGYFIFILVYLFVVSYITNSMIFSITSERFSDEEHFIETIKLFHKDISINNLKYYEDMSTPLPFLLYSMWSKLFGLNILSLRIFSVIIAVITFLLLYQLLFKAIKNSKTSFLLSVFIIINPYMTSLSILIFTDMTAILFLLLSIIAVIDKRPFLLAIGLSFSILSRQYLIFIALSSGLYFLILSLLYRRKEDIIMVISNIVCIIPLLLLVILWEGGLTPINQMRNLYIEKKITYNISYLFLYISLIFIYLIPVIIIRWKKILFKKLIPYIILFIISWIYWLFPIAPSISAIRGNFNTVGLFHRFLKIIFNIPLLEQIVFYISFLFGLIILYQIVIDLIRRIQNKLFDFEFFLNTTIISFLMIMPLSYLVWEKYFLPILPVLALKLVLLNCPDPLSRSSES